MARRAIQLLDGLIHGRAWIALVAFALIGIVTMQLGLLELNAGIGRALEHVASLQRENAELSVEDSTAAAGDAIELQATHLGMQFVPSGTLRFLSARDSAGDIARAAAALSAAATRSAEAAAASSSQAPAASGSEAPASGSAEAAPSQTPASAGEGEAVASAASAGGGTSAGEGARG